MKKSMITKNLVMVIQNLVGNYKSRPAKSIPVFYLETI